jgi:hypothetical protein
MHSHRDYAAESDPEKNYQFHQPWVDPPWPHKRKRGPVARAALETKSNSNSAATIHARARRLQVLWGLA